MASDTYDPCGHVCFRCGQCPDCCSGHEDALVRPRTDPSAWDAPFPHGARLPDPGAPLAVVRPRPLLRLLTFAWRLPRRIVRAFATGTDRLVDELAYGMWR